MLETWKPVKSYEGYYEVSNLGRVRSVERTILIKNNQYRKYKSVMLKPTLDTHGYMSVSLVRDNKAKTHTIYRLMAEAFIPNPDNLPCVNHKDGNKLNDDIFNLEWCTYSENIKHAYKNHLKRSGEQHCKHKLTWKDVDFIRKNYIPRDKTFGMRALGRKFNVGSSTVSQVIHNICWENR